MKKYRLFRSLLALALAAGLTLPTALAAQSAPPEATPAVVTPKAPVESQLLSDMHIEAAAAILVDADTGTVLFDQNAHEQRYPASITKILTALLIIENKQMTDTVTFGEHAVSESIPGNARINVQLGETITVEDALHAILLASANEVCTQLAIDIAGSEEGFAAMMNERAAALGCTNTHFVNANGLPDDDHYTTIYDMYLIFQAAIQTQDFIDIIHTQSYDAAYQNVSGNTVTQTWESTNRYLNGQTTEPEDITVIGGKTGTTNAAGYCLVLYSKNKKGDDIVSIVYKGKTRSDMYTLMNQILSTFAN